MFNFNNSNPFSLNVRNRRQERTAVVTFEYSALSGVLS
jgi:hypothetical protein